MYMQIHGTLDCKALNINCTMSAPGAYDDGGQYDNAPYKSCGKEPYSGVDSSEKGNAGFVNYVEMAGNGLFCMRVCEAGTMVPGGVCDVTLDTAGCTALMGVQFEDGFSYKDESTGVVTTTSIFLPPLPSSTTTSTKATASATSTNVVKTDANGGAAAGAKSSAKKLAAGIPLLAAVSAILF
ncbi:UNVERIFIED_CONTAM: hypothetical protein HDU68_009063 [Siphonaria sp. JEL0065]|nr:hypothetical protein HDU68_009063 [Siphonaria sp. JEL0065]